MNKSSILADLHSKLNIGDEDTNIQLSKQELQAIYYIIQSQNQEA